MSMGSSMGKKVETEEIRILVPVWVKDLVRQAAAREGVPVATLAASMLVEGARDTIGLPKPPDPVAPIPSVSDVLRAYVAGEERMIGPCGNSWPCEYDESESKYIGDCEFCGHCDIRVS